MVRKGSHFQNYHILFKMPVFKKIYYNTCKKTRNYGPYTGVGGGGKHNQQNILLRHPNVRLIRQINIAAFKKYG